jgi:hypothetical protein
MARLRALHSAVAIAVYGCDVGDRALIREGKIALAHPRYDEWSFFVAVNAQSNENLCLYLTLRAR